MTGVQKKKKQVRNFMRDIKDWVVEKLLFVLDILEGENSNNKSIGQIKDSIKKLKNVVIDSMENSSKVFLIGHNNPDFDSIGSCIGLQVLATDLEKDAYIILEDEIKIEPGVKKIKDENREKFNFIDKKTYQQLKDENSILIMCDVADQQRISIGDSLEGLKEIIIIDHHEETNTTFPTDKKFISTNVSSTCEVITQILNLERIKYPKEVADYLYAGIVLDTKRFKEECTSLTHDTAEKLLDRGASKIHVNNLFRQEIEEYRRINRLVIDGTNIKKYMEDTLMPMDVSFTLNREKPRTIYHLEDFAKAADIMQKMSPELSYALGYIDENTIYISARSSAANDDSKSVDVGKSMKKLGGGGSHQRAAAQIKVKDNKIVDAKKLKIDEKTKDSQEDAIFTVERKLMDLTEEAIQEIELPVLSLTPNSDENIINNNQIPDSHRIGKTLSKIKAKIKIRRSA